MVDTNVEIINKTGKVVESMRQQTDWIEKINELSIDEEVVQELFGLKNKYNDNNINNKIIKDYISRLDRREIMEKTYSIADKLLSDNKYKCLKKYMKKNNDKYDEQRFINKEDNSLVIFSCEIEEKDQIISAITKGKSDSTNYGEYSGETLVDEFVNSLNDKIQNIYKYNNKPVCSVNILIHEYLEDIIELYIMG